jgi:hypothetical protein
VNQQGFVKNRLTVTNFLEYASFVLNSIEEEWQVDFVYTDFSKAFDRVRHQLLLKEMFVGIEPSRCLWLRSYLTRRIQRIRIRLSSSVSQGSHLVFYLVCEQNLGDFRLRPCAVLRRWNEAISRQGFSGLYENSFGSE